jgi:tellurite methyltransferase
VSLEDWNARYRQREEIIDVPAPLLEDAAMPLPPGRALDLACGAGRNAMWLARQGWDVVAIDGAEEAIRIVREHAPEIDARVIDLEKDLPLPFPDESFDLIAILFFLHRPLYAEARRLLKPGGILVTAIRMRGINPRFCVAQGELRVMFTDYEMLRESEGEIAEIVARKRAVKL